MRIVPEGSFCVPAERSRVAGFLLSGQQPRNMVGDLRLSGSSSTRGFPLPWPQLHGESFTGVLLWSFEGKSLAAFRRKCTKLPGNPFYNVLTEDGRARRQELVMQWCV